MEISQCCKKSVYESFKGNDNNVPLIEIYRCEGCKNECEIENVCDECLGTREVDNIIFDENSKEFIMDGTKKCICQLKN